MSDKFIELDSVLDAESYEWLCDNAPPLADSVRKAVGNGVSPQQIRARVMERLGAHRMPLAARCEAAARHISKTMVERG